MKKTLLILFCAFLITSVFVSCKDKDTSEGDSTSEITTQTTTTTTTVTKEIIPDGEEGFGPLIPL